MSGNFKNVAQTRDVPPGKLLRVVIGEHALMLANVEGTIYATDDMCTHEDASLSTGALKGECVSCPLHGSRFNVRTGEPMEEPPDVPLRTWEVRVDGDDILIAID